MTLRPWRKLQPADTAPFRPLCVCRPGQRGMDSNHGEVVGLRHLIQGNPQASGYIFERHALIEVAGKNELLQRREGLHRVHRYRQHAGQLGLVLDVLRIGGSCGSPHAARLQEHHQRHRDG